MNQFKFFLKRYQKEILLGGILIVFVIAGFGIYIAFSQKENKNSKDIDLVSIEEKKEEVEESEQQTKEEEIIRIDIKGEIKNPGVYTILKDSRVIDVIEKAGGLTKLADTSVNNLSRKVKDEMVIIIYSKKEVEEFVKTKEKIENIFENVKDSEKDLINNAALEKEDILTNQNEFLKDFEKEDEKTANTDQKEEKKVSINTATREELLSINGIGESKAKAIIEYRTEHGRFEKLEDIMNVSGIGESLFAKIKDFIEI